MAEKRVIKINDIQIKNPHDFKISRFNLTKSGRTSSGKMTMDIIAKKRKFEFKYEVISGKHLKEILDIVDSDEPFFELEYPDVNGEQQTATVYAGAIPYEHFRRFSGEYWKGLAFSLIEQ